MKKYGELRIDLAFREAINTIKFFPSIAELNEIIQNLPPKWFYQNLEVEKMTITEKQELDEILESLEEVKYER